MATAFDPDTFAFVNAQTRAALQDQFDYEQALQRQQNALDQELGGYQFQVDQEQVGLAQALRNAQARAAQASAAAALEASNAQARAALQAQQAQEDATFGNYRAQQQGALQITQGQRGYDTGATAADAAKAQALRDLLYSYQDAGSQFAAPFLQRGLQNSGIVGVARDQLNTRYADRQGDARSAYEQQIRQLSDALTGTREGVALNTDLTQRSGALGVSQATAAGQLSASQAAANASMQAANAQSDAQLATQAAQEGFDLAAKEIKRRQQSAQKSFDIWKDQALGSNQFRSGIRDQQAGEYFTTQALGGLGSGY